MAGEVALRCLTHIHICKAGSLRRRLAWTEFRMKHTLIVHTQGTRSVCVCERERKCVSSTQVPKHSLILRC